MKVIRYVGVEEPVIIIERDTDLYPALDFLQTKMIELGEAGNKAADKCAEFISILMEQAEKEGFGDYEDVDNIEWG